LALALEAASMQTTPAAQPSFDPKQRMDGSRSFTLECES
jgi:hypothetical protein